MWYRSALFPYSNHFFCEVKNKKTIPNRTHLLGDCSELQSVAVYSKMCHSRSENVTQLLLINEAAMAQSDLILKMSSSALGVSH